MARATVAKREVERAQNDAADPWRIGNAALYDLCSRYPYHSDDSEIVAKVWLIGRTYAAAIERGKGDIVGVGVTNDNFYVQHVAPMLRRSRLDAILASLRRYTRPEQANTTAVLDAHYYLTGLFQELTGKTKRSLASKYLHFHLPQLVFIYDSRAALAIRGIGLKEATVRPSNTIDRTYATFVMNAVRLRDHAYEAFSAELTPRQLDRLLLARAASQR